MYIAGFFYVFVDGAADPRAKVLVSTHSSLWDSLWLIFYLGTTQGAKVELFTLPIMGDFLKALLSLPIDRNSADGRRVAIGEIALRCADPHYPPLLLFPTGCCTNTRQLIQFKRGAFQPLCPIQPIGISYPSRFYDMKLNSSSLWDLYRSVCQFANHMAVTFLPIRYPSADEREDPILWSRNVREEMAVKLGMQLVDYRYEDEMIRIQCRDSNVYLNDLKIEIKNYPLIEKLLDAFVLVDTNNDGWICLDDIQIAAGRHISVTEYGDLLATVKLPPIDHYCYSNRDHFPNYDTWTEQGWIGWLTGGRPKLQKRGIDLYLPNKIEFAEVVNYINKLTDPHMSKHTKRIDYFVDMFGASNILVD
jgi:1-acyl-sn-glycerol-3-phosphate acyltransferase